MTCQAEIRCDPPDCLKLLFGDRLEFPKCFAFIVLVLGRQFADGVENEQLTHGLRYPVPRVCLLLVP